MGDRTARAIIKSDVVERIGRSVGRGSVLEVRMGTAWTTYLTPRTGLLGITHLDDERTAERSGTPSYSTEKAGELSRCVTVAASAGSYGYMAYSFVGGTAS